MKKLRIDIVSDVVCPWCILAYQRLSIVLDQLSTQIEPEIHWHPFELNPLLSEGGENLQQHLTQKYGITNEESNKIRDNLVELGKEVGFTFNFSPEMKTYNTRKAHQLLLIANQYNRQLPLKLALFNAYFTENRAIDQIEVLIDIAQSVGLSREACMTVLDDDSWAQAVAETERQWLDANIQAVPVLIFNQRTLVTGAQSPQELRQLIEDMLDDLPHLH
jgi:predicted DsbA family dithiol-disulfide isomerase